MNKSFLIFFISLVLFLFLFFVEAKALQRTKCGYEITSGYIFNAFNENLLSNWNNGWTIGFGFSYALNPSTEFLAHSSYQNYSYTGDNISLITPGVVGFRWDVEGEKSQLYELSLGARFVNGKKFIRPFITFRSGLIFMDIGDIIITTWNVQNPKQKNKSNYSGSGEFLIKGLTSFGLGITLPIKQKTELIFESRFSIIFNKISTFIPINFSMRFKL